VYENDIYTSRSASGFGHVVVSGKTRCRGRLSSGRFADADAANYHAPPPSGSTENATSIVSTGVLCYVRVYDSFRKYIYPSPHENDRFSRNIDNIRCIYSNDRRRSDTFSNYTTREHGPINSVTQHFYRNRVQFDCPRQIIASNSIVIRTNYNGTVS